ncbi:MAG: response regulator transcription factor [Bacteroidota bacterium]
MSIRIVLADDHVLVRNGIKALLADVPDLQVIAEASNGEEAISLVASHQPDILIADIRMPVLNGLETTQKLKIEHPQTKVLILSMHDSDEYVLEAARRGAYGYLPKDIDKTEFVKAIQTVAEGAKFFSGSVSQILVTKFLELDRRFSGITPQEEIHLTRREKQVLKMIVKGMTNKEIADQLEKSVRTIETHRFNLMKKLRVKNLAELSLKVKDMGYLLS